MTALGVIRRECVKDEIYIYSSILFIITSIYMLDFFHSYYVQYCEECLGVKYHLKTFDCFKLVYGLSKSMRLKVKKLFKSFNALYNHLVKESNKPQGPQHTCITSP
uniref:Uncharacterized protein n=1 Tax=Glossina austeni TaxID=7395 RepID=A0A1A9VD25_GLOAU